MKLIAAIFRFFFPGLHSQLRYFRNTLTETREDVRSILYAHLLHGRNFPPAIKELPSREIRPEVDVNTFYENTLSQLRTECPQSFDKWYQLLNVNEETYIAEPEGSCSIEGHPEAELFGGFVRPYLRGYVLDVGCGPQDIPLYLKHYPQDLISGIDPLKPTGKHPFEFYRCFCENLPWKDQVFDAALIGTSFDHVLLPEQCLREIYRVLTDDGKLLVWISFVPDAVDYNPYDPNLQPIDQFHLFHFSRKYFYKVITPLFSVVEAVRINEVSTFVTLTKKILK